MNIVVYKVVFLHKIQKRVRIKNKNRGDLTIFEKSLGFLQ